jgi:ABC-type thiamin/hydroxymethylpyrimidine transport system permease subunit
MFAQWKTRDLIITAVLAVALGILMIVWTAVY